MTGELQLSDENGHENGTHHELSTGPEAPPFKISSEVERVMRAGQEIRRITFEIKERLSDVIAQMLVDFPSHAMSIAKTLEGEAQKIRSIHEQEIRRERESRRNQEEQRVTNGSSEGRVSDGVSGIPGEQSGSGSSSE
jgi:hypothetical protein